MKYLLALILPPVAVLLCRKPGQCILNIILCMLFLIPGIIHAMLVVADYNAEKRVARLEKALHEKI